MANPRSAWGIDIGNRALKALKLVRDSSGALKVSDFEVIEHETLLSNAGDNRDSLIQSALANFVQRKPDKRSAVAVSVSGSSSLARFIKLPPVEPKKIPEIVRFEAIQQIPFPLDDVEWSYQLFKGTDSPDVEVGIFAMRKELINHHLKFFTDVGLGVEAVQLNPLAVYNAMQYDQRLSGATMIVDLGSENTDLIIADGETIWLRSIPIGGKNFTEVLVKQFKLSFSKAEELKRTAATSKYAKQIFQAMRPVFADLVAEVQRSIGFYASVHRDSRLVRVLALGGTFRLPGLQKYLQQNLQLDVARIDRLEAGGPADAKQRGAFEENLLSLASAYGLAIQAMGEAKITSSLLPASIRREKLWKDKIPWFAGTAAGFLLGAGVAMGSYFLQNFEYGQNASVREHLTDVLNQAKTLDDQWSNQVEAQGTGDRQRIANIQSMMQYRELWPGLMADITGALPVPSDPVLLTGDWAKIKAKVPRANRDIILIDSMTSTYDTDLSKLPFAPAANATGAPATPDQTAAPAASAGQALLPNGPATPIPAGTHGFRLTLNVVTPYGGDVVPALTFAVNKFLPRLRAIKGDEYSVLYADITSRQLVQNDSTYVQALTARMTNWNNLTQAGGPNGVGAIAPPTVNVQTFTQTYAPSGGGAGARNSMMSRYSGGAGARGGGGDFGGGYTPPPPPVQTYNAPSGGGGPAAPSGTLIDPLTNEDMGNDTVLEVTVVVGITPPGGSAPAPQ